MGIETKETLGEGQEEGFHLVPQKGTESMGPNFYILKSYSFFIFFYKESYVLNQIFSDSQTLPSGLMYAANHIIS